MSSGNGAPSETETKFPTAIDAGWFDLSVAAVNKILPNSKCPTSVILETTDAKHIDAEESNHSPNAALVKSPPAFSLSSKTLAKSRKWRPLLQLLCCLSADPPSEWRCVSRQPKLLGPQHPSVADRICAVLDLDETLVHSSFRKMEDPDFVVKVEIDNKMHDIFVKKRPFVDQFLERMSQLFECVLFTASLAKYAEPVSDILDRWSAFKYRLFREACVLHSDSFVKDLGLLGRQVERCLIIDNSPASYMFNKENAIQVTSWLGDAKDTELLDLLPYMERLAVAASVPAHLQQNPPPSDSYWSSCAGSDCAGCIG